MGVSILILTGQSGSGKSTALRALEDRGFLCVDNLPPSLIEGLAEAAAVDAGVDRLAVVVDARDPGLLRGAPAVIERLRGRPDPAHLIYFEAREEILLRRYSETRRRHPLDRGEGLRSALERERDILLPLREIADETLDTSGASPHELRDRVTRQLAGERIGDHLHLDLVSFGFKYGLPLDADMVFDVRFLPNPYFVPELRDMSGLDTPVRDWVVSGEETRELLERTTTYLEYLLPQFRREGKEYLTVAVGCTGGQHRSVAIVKELGARLGGGGVAAHTRHRDVGRGRS